ncbi:GntR family transcriptional regulator [Crenobacter luteus]|uniref:aminotransferase-like domain-containing protein n=1 Tax=Crenobacter luteus TaxID=1452487 RepID=UPI00104C62D9|nr:PLP-dependent aminotransferase family protein [Crenobacter luteus]TCP14895.1 GntR family transcriptional regulator [Crenobacter luteus]
MLTLDKTSPTPLTEQIVAAVAERVARGLLPVGSRLPSVRALAKALAVSPFTVAEAYNRLSAQGWIEARPARGHFVAPRPRPAAAPLMRAPVDEAWLIRRVYEDDALTLPAGGGWLPGDWLHEEGMRSALRQLARGPAERLTRYGHPQGLTALREHLAWQLALRGIEAPAAQIVLTHGASQALDLAIRLVVRPGDAVLVETPGYSNLLTALRAHGARLLPVPRTAAGPDPDALATLAEAHRPVAFFTNTQLHNPTGTCTKAATAFRLLQLAERFDFTLVEDDPFAELAASAGPTLASLDALRRVIYLGSFSKTISPALRVGFLAAAPATVTAVSQLKMAGALTSSPLNEAATLAIVTDGHYRSHLERLRDRLAEAQRRVADALEALGWRLFHRPAGGLFLWARAPDGVDAKALTDAAAAAGIALAPGAFYQSEEDAEAGWFRFNVACSLDARLFDFLAGVPRR